MPAAEPFRRVLFVAPEDVLPGDEVVVNPVALEIAHYGFTVAGLQHALSDEASEALYGRQDRARLRARYEQEKPTRERTVCIRRSIM